MLRETCSNAMGRIHKMHAMLPKTVNFLLKKCWAISREKAADVRILKAVNFSNTVTSNFEHQQHIHILHVTGCNLQAAMSMTRL